MFKGGRPAGLVWQYFYKVESNGKIVARCKCCGYQMPAKCARMQVHHNKCNKTTPRPGPTLGPDAAPTQAQKRPRSKSISPAAGSRGCAADLQPAYCED